MARLNFKYGILLTLFSFVQSLDVTVDTTSGLTEGVRVDPYNVIKFLGIPYAEPPIGHKRFQRPIFKSRMAGKFNASNFGLSCPQPLIIEGQQQLQMSEDCLFLNIFAPINASRTNSLSVMVWIHGGAYILGSSTSYDPTILVGFHDVIVVTTNYRLGILGFFSTLDENAVGNFGLWDQAMALQWVKANIANFGGNPDSITIFGESSGSSSVTQLAISPMAQGLFHRVIAESGSLYSPWSFNKNPLNTAQRLGRRLGCPTNNKKTLVQCMKGVPVDTIMVNQEFTVEDFINGKAGWVPAYMGEFFPYSPEELLTTHKASTVAKRLAEMQFMIGLNTEEGATVYSGLMYPYRVKGEVNDSFEGLPKLLFQQLVAQFSLGLTSGNTRHAHGIQQTIEYMYTDWKLKNGMSRSKMLINLISDTLFNAPSVKLARAHSTLRNIVEESKRDAHTGRTYFYRFNHRGSWTTTEPWRSGADHGDEVPFVYGGPLAGLLNATSEEVQLSRAVMTYWTNFAKTGNPNQPPNTNIRTDWPEFNTETEEHIELDVGMSQDSTGHHIWGERVAFWLEYYPEQLALIKRQPDPSVCV